MVACVDSQNNGRFKTLKGPDDMPAHIKTALAATRLSIPFRRGELPPGSRQGVCLREHRERAKGGGASGSLVFRTQGRIRYCARYR